MYVCIKFFVTFYFRSSTVEFAYILTKGMKCTWEEIKSQTAKNPKIARQFFSWENHQELYKIIHYVHDSLNNKSPTPLEEYCVHNS